MRAGLVALAALVLVLLGAPPVAYAGQTSAPGTAIPEARDQRGRNAMAAKKATPKAIESTRKARPTVSHDALKRARYGRGAFPEVDPAAHLLAAGYAAAEHVREPSATVLRNAAEVIAELFNRVIFRGDPAALDALAELKRHVADGQSPAVLLLELCERWRAREPLSTIEPPAARIAPNFQALTEEQIERERRAAKTAHDLGARQLFRGELAAKIAPEFQALTEEQIERATCGAKSPYDLAARLAITCQGLVPRRTGESAQAYDQRVRRKLTNARRRVLERKDATSARKL